VISEVSNPSINTNTLTYKEFFSWARWTALATTPSTRWQSAGQLGDQHSNVAAGLKANLRVGHFNV